MESEQKTNKLWRYIDNVDSDLLCPICTDPFIDPVLFSCGEHTYCRNCVEKCNKKCAMCNFVSIGEPKQAPALIRSLVGKLKIVCLSCDKEMKRDDFSSHYTNACPISCVFGCGTTFSRNDLIFHDALCSEKPIDCDADVGCPFKGKRKEMLKHHENCVFMSQREMILRNRTVEDSLTKLQKQFEAFIIQHKQDIKKLEECIENEKKIQETSQLQYKKGIKKLEECIENEKKIQETSRLQYKKDIKILEERIVEIEKKIQETSQLQYKKGIKILEERIVEIEKKPIPNWANIKFKLDAKTIKGIALTLNLDLLSVTKKSTGHCAILSTTCFNQGCHVWNVLLKPRHSWTGEYWLMVGVHADPNNVKTHPSGDSGVYGLSVSNNLNGWITKAGNTVYQKERKVEPGETVQITLNCNNKTLTVTNNKWTATITDLPNTPLYPYFDPYDLDFSIFY